MFDYKKHILHAPDEALPTPVTTKEQYLYAKVTGGDTNNLPTPVTTEEQYLYAMVQSGGDGGGGGNVLRLYAAQGAESDHLIAYKDESRTETYASYDEAKTAVMTAGAILFHIYDVSYGGYLDQVFFAGGGQWIEDDEVVVVYDLTGCNVYLFGSPKGDSEDHSEA